MQKSFYTNLFQALFEVSTKNYSIFKLWELQKIMSDSMWAISGYYEE